MPSQSFSTSSSKNLPFCICGFPRVFFLVRSDPLFSAFICRSRPAPGQGMAAGLHFLSLEAAKHSQKYSGAPATKNGCSQTELLHGRKSVIRNAYGP